jgi:hypothetical protein
MANKIMEKKELLETVGFSSEFINQLDRVENEDLYNFQTKAFSNESFDLSVHDTSELFMENQLKKDSNSLELV